MPSSLLTAALLFAPLASRPQGPEGVASPTGPESVERVAAVMGTVLTIEVQAPTRAEALAASERALRAVEAAEARLSTWRADTELARVVAAAEGQGPRTELELSPTLARELGSALELARLTGGAFDPTAGALVRAFDLRGQGRWPGPAELAAACARVGLERVTLRGQVLSLRAGTVLEEGAFGKGAALDAALAALAEGGAPAAACLDLGGQLILSPTAAPRSVPVAHPDRRQEPAAHLRLDPGESLAVSGNSERSLPHPQDPDGARRLGHLLDPRTGLPAPDFGALAVVAPDGLTADALSTGLYVLGPRGALALAERLPGVEVLVLERQPAGLRLSFSSGLQGRLLTATLTPKSPVDR